MISSQPLCLRHEIGDVLKDRYTIRQVLGAGAFGTVYRVEETLGARTVNLAAKEMHVLDDPETAVNERADALRMFQEEAYLLQTLRNPHIPAAHFESDKGVWLACPICGRAFRGTRHCPDHGSLLQVVNERYYLLMDFIEGPDLEEKLLSNGGRPLEESEVIDWTLQVCSALEAVHAKGFSHRDIKPANIKIQEEGAHSHAMLIDFGLIKPSMVAGRYGTILQRKSTALGTLGYAPVSSEEQQAPDARTDILALGMTMYRVLTHLDPTDAPDLAQMRARKPRELNSVLSPMIESIILKATQVDRNARYADVAALRADLLAARYPVETKCPHCGNVQRSLHAPDANARCERCGRPILSLETTSYSPQSTLSVGATSARSNPSTSSASSTAPRLWQRANPHEARLSAIRRELSQPLSTSKVSVYDARIREIEAILERTKRFTVGANGQCPACRQSTLQIISGQPTGQCPLCQREQLVRRSFELNGCPVCREGNLATARLREQDLFCPICREVPLQIEERRAMMGLAVDEWWKCPRCLAGWDIDNKRMATLKEFTFDPLGVGAAHQGQTLPFAQWKALAGRSDNLLECDHCQAQFEPLDEEHLRLMHAPNDPFGVAKSVGQLPLDRTAWAKLAQGLPTSAGTHACPHCHAEWDYDRAHGAMTLRREGDAMPDWAARWRGIAVALPAWYTMAAGKRSPHPGRLCPNASCHSEWDEELAGWKLVGTENLVLQPAIGAVMLSEDWRRSAMQLPTVAESTLLRQELKELQAKKAAESEQAQKEISRGRGALQEERAELYKTSILEGYVRLQRMSPATSAADWKHTPGTFVVLPLNIAHSALHSGEELRWESPATKCGVEIKNNTYRFSRQLTGSLVVTDQRLQFVNTRDDQPTQVWQQSLGTLRRAEVIPVDKSVVVVIQFAPPSQPAGFEIQAETWNLKDGDDLIPITMKPYDLVKLLRDLGNFSG